MATGKYLNDEEKDRTVHLFGQGHNASQIGKLINRSHVTVKKYLNCPSGYGQKMKITGCKSVLTERQKREVIRWLGTYSPGVMV